MNVLKNNGHSLEHNFGHGKETLSSLLVALNLLAFAIHGVCDILEYLWQKAREKAGARNRLFTLLWAISTCNIFPSWSSLLRTIISGVPPPQTT